MKRYVSVLLVLILIVSSVTTAFANTPDNPNLEVHHSKEIEVQEDFDTMSFLTTYTRTYKDVTLTRVELMDLRDEIRAGRGTGAFVTGILIGAYGLIPGLNLSVAIGSFATGTACAAAATWTRGADDRIDKILRDYPSTQTFYCRVESILEKNIHMVVQKVTYTDVLIGIPWTPGMDGIGIASTPVMTE